ncbi:accessory Sec system protein translocase subunit SecY2 [Staphylococcus pseudintermedius]|uniref:Accessory Sec system protein translocase subunit SecY2 n=1 Tax=Staphylococcus pseudintermedius TaxID=283734 RepID=A0A317Z8G2_STAPS|nr:accessory Sec system protein translocase subunit SecY2 [Staphylococcus pseudintermedius]
MSWFDQLFGENDKDQSSQRSTRRRKSEATREEKHASFVQQSQDVYQRPRGKFRFPIEMHDEVVERHHQQADTTQTQDVTMHTQLHERRPSFTVDRQHRRHRGVQQARCYEQQQTRGSNSTHSNSHQNDYTFAAQSSQHSKKPKRHRDDIVAKPNYHQKPFQASEVPSAIFGTKQPKKIENSGLNQPPGARKAMPQLQKNERVVQEATPQAESTTTRQNRTIERSGTSKSPTRRHNTIHIENIYASQIVEEIRREREKKMLQKKNFKEALKKKRESYEQHANPDIQKAIDEMYSAQARQLLGDQYTESTDETISEDLLNEETVDATTEQNKDTTTLTSNFEYEEVDLSEVESENHDESDSSTNEEIAENELDIEALSFEDESGISQVEDAQQHRDTHAHTTTSDETTANKVETDASDIEFEVVEVDDDNALDDMITDETDGERIDSEIESDSVDVDIEDEDVNEQQGQQVGSMPKLEPELKPELAQSNEALEKSVEKVTPQQNDTVTAEQLSEATEVSQQTEQPKPYKVPIRKGSKPFNVVMTPSDKKRLMSRQQQAKKEEATEQPVRPVQPVEQQSSSQLTTQHVHNETQTGDSQQPQSQQEVKTIRRGPNLKLPSLDLLEAPEEQEQDENWIAEKKEELNNAFYYFNVPAEVVNVVEGPSVTRFELSVERGVKVSRITALQDDIKMALAAMIIISLITYKNMEKAMHQTRAEKHYKEKFLTLGLSIIQGYFVINQFVRHTDAERFTELLLLLILVTGAMLMMWLADQNMRYGIAGPMPIVLLSVIKSMFTQSLPIVSIEILMLVVMVILIIVALFILLLTELIEYRIHYRDIIEMPTPGQPTYLAWKINPGGSISIMISLSVFLLLTSTINLIFNMVTGKTPHLQWLSFGHYMGVTIYLILQTVLGYLLSRLIVNTKQNTKDFLKNGNYFIGIRPGADTGNYLNHLAKRLCWFGTTIVTAIIGVPLYISLLVPDLSEYIYFAVQLMIMVYLAMNITETMRTYLYFDKYGAFLNQYW